MTTNDKPRIKNKQKLGDNYNTISYINEANDKYKLSKRSQYNRRSMEYLDYQDNNNVIMKVQGEIQIDLINDDNNNRKMMK